ncbi:hypothetical protein HU200_031567 [Digitaria exilis]|uniref:Uncharacterized protein n=1 Tax=Digitaria exilis TaxID=1010633 RepID=A0A835BQF0_9POAL|nr:hypothetical protein HU200_031567 [Digitaria exilis]CAB3485171.1 unnamed protein product [Digitaria exilis]
MASATNTKPHFVLFPWTGTITHVIPMTDLGCLLASHGAEVTIITTPVNAAIAQGRVDRAPHRAAITVTAIPFPGPDAGLPDGLERMDLLRSQAQIPLFFVANKGHGEAVSRYCLDNKAPGFRRPSCIISGMCQTWTLPLARQLGVPCYVFHGFGAFAMLCIEHLFIHRTHEAVASEDEFFSVPALPPPLVCRLTSKQLPPYFMPPNSVGGKALQGIRDFDVAADGIVVNTFEELECGSVELLAEATGKKVLAVGPVSLCPRSPSPGLDPRESMTDDARRCMAWLDGKEAESVVYVSFGSGGRMQPAQLMQLGMALVSCSSPVLWLIKGADSLPDDVKEWLRENTDGDGAANSKCLVVRGWAPQVDILAHPAVGGFMTHCGWGSTLEAVAAGVPMATWPFFAEQFVNEQLIVDALGIGVSVGVTKPTENVLTASNAGGSGGEAEPEVGMEQVKKALEMLMDRGPKGEQRRKKVQELKLKANGALEKGGSAPQGILSSPMQLDMAGGGALHKGLGFGKEARGQQAGPRGGGGCGGVEAGGAGQLVGRGDDDGHDGRGPWNGATECGRLPVIVDGPRSDVTVGPGCRGGGGGKRKAPSLASPDWRAQQGARREQKGNFARMSPRRLGKGTKPVRCLPILARARRQRAEKRKQARPLYLEVKERDMEGTTRPHLVLIPWQGGVSHIIPMTDIGCLLASHGAAVTIITTPANAPLVQSRVDGATPRGAGVTVTAIPFPAAEAGLPEGSERLDLLRSPADVPPFFAANKRFGEAVARHCSSLPCRPSCIVAGMCHPWSLGLARDLGVPCYIFHGFGAFALLCIEHLFEHRPHEAVACPDELFDIPALPPFECRVSRRQLPPHFAPTTSMGGGPPQEMRGFDAAVDGVVVNTFEELEHGSAALLAAARGQKVLAVGPVSLSHSPGLDPQAMPSDDARRCVAWLDTKAPRSVVYVSFGSAGCMPPAQLLQLGMALVSCPWPVLWVVKGADSRPDGVKKWMSENTDADGVADSKCLVVRGWAPQVAILAHPAVGGFLTHCGWGSTLEAVAAGVPVATWPLFAEQFINERLIVDVLGVGVSVGVKRPTENILTARETDEGSKAEVEAEVGMEQVTKALERLMDQGAEGEERRKKAQELKLKAKGIQETEATHTQCTKPHFVVIPWPATSHMIPIVDIACLLAAHGAAVTVITTHASAQLVHGRVERAGQGSSDAITVTAIPFPAAEAGLPDGCERLDHTPSVDLVPNFFDATTRFGDAVAHHLTATTRPPASCIIAGMCNTWAHGLARELGAPCLIFHGFGAFALLCCEYLNTKKPHEAVASMDELFDVPVLPPPFEIRFARRQLPLQFLPSCSIPEIRLRELREFEMAVDGIVVNSFDELEHGSASRLASATGNKAVFAVGPVSLCGATSQLLDSDDARRCMAWLDAKKEDRSVLYVSFGSAGRMPPEQLMQLGLALVSCPWPVLWVIKGADSLPGHVSKWLQDNTDAEDGQPESQCLTVAILEHPAVGGFLTHCGWGSTLESVAAGVPMATWPFTAEQFLNEKLIVDVLRIGVSVGVTKPTDGVLTGGKNGGGEKADVGTEQVRRVLDMLMDGGVDGEARKTKAQELKPHFVVIPWPSISHMIPIVDIACLLAAHGAPVTLITTPASAAVPTCCSVPERRLRELREFEMAVDGIVVNSFDDLEHGSATGKAVFAVGPVSLCVSPSVLDGARAGSDDTRRCMAWLDAKEDESVLYVCFGSAGRMPPAQLMQLGLALVSCSWPVLWAIKGADSLPDDIYKGLHHNTDDGDGFPEGQCLVVRGWAPQVAILEHPAVGGFLTHCGWGSTLESVAAGQFLNEKLIVDVLGIGVSIGATTPTKSVLSGSKDCGFGQAKPEVGTEQVKRADGTNERKAQELKSKAKAALEKGGSSDMNLEKLVHFAA